MSPYNSCSLIYDRQNDMNVVGHYAEGQEFKFLAISEVNCLCNNSCYIVPTQPIGPGVDSVQVFIKAFEVVLLFIHLQQFSLRLVILLAYGCQPQVSLSHQV